MVSRFISRRRTCGPWASLLQAGIFVLSLSAATSGWGQAPPFYSVPTGHQPLGVDIASGTDGNEYAVVANSGDSSVSIFKLNTTAQPVALTLATTVTGIPSPYAVAACPGGRALVTSPSNNSVTLIQIPQGQVLGTLTTGTQPYSVTCSGEPAVSNLGDSTLVLLDLNPLTIAETLQGIPGSRGFHGIAFTQFPPKTGAPPTVGVVAGTDANTITVMGPNGLAQLPFTQPTAVSFNTGNSGETFPPETFWAASAQANSVFLFEPLSGKVDQIIQNVPNPQDAVATSINTRAGLKNTSA